MALNPSTTSTTAQIQPSGQVTEPTTATQPIVATSKTTVDTLTDTLDKLNQAVSESQPKTQPVGGTTEERAAAGDVFAYGGNRPGTPKAVAPAPYQDIYGPQGKVINSSGQVVTLGKNAADIQAQTTASEAAAGGITETKDKSADYIPGTTILRSDRPDLAAIIDQHNQNIANDKNEIANIQNQLIQLQNNNYVSPATASLLASISSMFDVQINKQEDINTRVLAGFTQAGIRSGLERYAPEINTNRLTQVANDGISKINDILIKKADALSKAQAAATKNDFDILYKQMNEYQKQADQEQKESMDLLKNVRDEQKALDEANKSQLDRIATQQKIDKSILESAAYNVLAFLDQKAGGRGESTLDEDIAAVKEYASANNLDPQSLLSATEQLKTTKDKYGSGPIGQFQFYRDQGGVLNYQDFLNQVYRRSSTTQEVNNATNAMNNQLKNRVGKDGFISPEDYLAARNAWIQEGLSPTIFDTKFKGFRNPNDTYNISGQGGGNVPGM